MNTPYVRKRNLDLPEKLTKPFILCRFYYNTVRDPGPEFSTCKSKTQNLMNGNIRTQKCILHVNRTIFLVNLFKILMYLSLFRVYSGWKVVKDDTDPDTHLDKT